MKKRIKTKKVNLKKLVKDLQEAKKDPKFRKAVKEFVKLTTS